MRSIKEEALGRMIFIGEGSLRYAINQYRTHYHQERNHQGLDNQLIAPEAEVVEQTGQVVCRERLGGLLGYYYREAASLASNDWANRRRLRFATLAS